MSSTAPYELCLCNNDNIYRLLVERHTMRFHDTGFVECLIVFGPISNFRLDELDTTKPVSLWQATKLHKPGMAIFSDKIIYDLHYGMSFLKFDYHDSVTLKQAIDTAEEINKQHDKELRNHLTALSASVTPFLKLPYAAKNTGDTISDFGKCFMPPSIVDKIKNYKKEGE